MKYLAIIALLSANLLAACSGSGQQASTGSNPAAQVQSVAIDQLSTQLTAPEAVILDVRTPEEFSQGHLKGAINLDYSGGVFQGEMAKLDKNKKYYLYCRSGGRSGKSAQLMVETGFTQVYNMGGIGKLEQAGVPME